MLFFTYLFPLKNHTKSAYLFKMYFFLPNLQYNLYSPRKNILKTTSINLNFLHRLTILENQIVH